MPTTIERLRSTFEDRNRDTAATYRAAVEAAAGDSAEAETEAVILPMLSAIGKDFDDFERDVSLLRRRMAWAAEISGREKANADHKAAEQEIAGLAAECKTKIAAIQAEYAQKSQAAATRRDKAQRATAAAREAYKMLRETAPQHLKDYAKSADRSRQRALNGPVKDAESALKDAEANFARIQQNFNDRPDRTGWSNGGGVPGTATAADVEAAKQKVERAKQRLSEAYGGGDDGLAATERRMLQPWPDGCESLT